MPWAARIKMALEVACALQHLHEKGIIHGNLSCCNVLVRRDLSVALSGFSMSKYLYRLDDRQSLSDSQSTLMSESDIYR